MTVAELRKVLKGMPPKMPVVLSRFANRSEFRRDHVQVEPLIRPVLVAGRETTERVLICVIGD